MSLEWILTKRWSQVISLTVLLAYVDSFSASKKANVVNKAFNFKRLRERLTAAYPHYMHRLIVGKSSKQVVITSEQPNEAPHKLAWCPGPSLCLPGPRQIQNWEFPLPSQCGGPGCPYSPSSQKGRGSCHPPAPKSALGGRVGCGSAFPPVPALTHPLEHVLSIEAEFEHTGSQHVLWKL